MHTGRSWCLTYRRLGMPVEMIWFVWNGRTCSVSACVSSKLPVGRGQVHIVDPSRTRRKAGEFYGQFCASCVTLPSLGCVENARPGMPYQHFRCYCGCGLMLRKQGMRKLERYNENRHHYMITGPTRACKERRITSRNAV